MQEKAELHVFKIFVHKTSVLKLAQALHKNHPETPAKRELTEKSNQQQNRFSQAAVITLTHCILFSQTNHCCPRVSQYSGLPE